MLGRFHTVFSTFMCPGIIFNRTSDKNVCDFCNMCAYFYNYSYKSY